VHSSARDARPPVATHQQAVRLADRGC